MYSENVSLFLFLVFHPFPFHCTSSPSPLQRGEKHCGQNKMPDRHVSVCPRVGSTWLNHPIPRLILLSPIAGGLLVFCTRRHVSTWWWVGHKLHEGKDRPSLFFNQLWASATFLGPSGLRCGGGERRFRRRLWILLMAVFSQRDSCLR